MDEWVAAVGAALRGARRLFAGGPVAVGRLPGLGGRPTTDWQGQAHDNEHNAIRALDNDTQENEETSQAVDQWSQNVAGDSADGANRADTIYTNADNTARALAPQQNTVNGKATLIRALNNHLGTADQLLNQHAGRAGIRRQELLALLARQRGTRTTNALNPTRQQTSTNGFQIPQIGGGGGGGSSGGGSGSGGGGGFNLGSLFAKGGGGTRPPAGAGSAGSGDLIMTGGPAVFGNYDAGQMQVAKSIVAEGVRRHLPPKAMQIAIATALQESGMRSLANPNVPASMQIPHQGVGRDHDSVGPFQQRQSWGATADLMNPATSAGKFYDKLVRIPGWQEMPLTQAAQRVQVSAYPNAYAKHTGPAGQIVAAILQGR
ncbi:Uncharacterised protein [Mycobacteroides abscessus subsp. abscessus]|uniref:hypothetical protein n=1 Tax=Mycobacteroides abscessus TaxID=36809 RepID=UPI00092B499E|nr:hypothetical protein [Mycobacteroides abscessus]SHY53547.1 Uncharacterised protein [Mycobacteroides abscessus subsp. abscessus]